jgi:flavin-dependent dehydrogenase
MGTDFDVVVVGAGPGGSAAAKTCAEGGLKTLLLEKQRLPRNKVCSGGLSQMAQSLVEETFGSPPLEVLADPPYVRGVQFHAPGIDTIILEHRASLMWRKNFDFWLNQIAQEAGAQLWEKSRLRGITEIAEGYDLNLNELDRERHVKAKFVIGADGTLSVIRMALFKQAKMSFQRAIRYCYKGKLDLDPEHVHYFALPDLTFFSVNFKDDVFLLEMGPRRGRKKEELQKAERLLKKGFGLHPHAAYLWRDGCLEPAMLKQPFSGASPLGRGNALLVGNAAGLVIPLTGEGIAPAIKSGNMAANAVIQALRSDRYAEAYYLPEARGLVSRLEKMYPPPGKLSEAMKRGMDTYFEMMREIWLKSFDLF